ncbi:opioid growth factor receptor-related protein [Brevundimonas subvibrioides]|uniref:Opioid growth factor receptor (OGFr) conserved region n=1 Tax=Brevundimonas subvibrioides (strain ATCC 15264 / DSM 4735 / LMG 14903 / NBRC 16000 / CB 81) TaxID=633149 RepID=D9QMB9_BRESC|nr:opioid growth factor receptor-related protein [Brevundimonas subvibrioides]ADL02045.1 Opioid growth factor receptor (OGFr) conserved region [Brevundimonas subvibrioides ATCC 15264]
MSAIVDFLKGAGTDGAGRTVFEVVAMDDRTIERSHDFIQWLFPLDAPSGANRNAPVLGPGDVAAIHDCGMAQIALAAATDRMSVFYQRNTHWLVVHDHNHLRITRIIKSLRLLRGPGEAEDFHSLILRLDEAAGRPVSVGSRRYWAEA